MKSLIWLTAIGLLGGLSNPSGNEDACSAWKRLLTDVKPREEVLKWADSQIFSRTFSQGDLTWGRLHGPGRMKAISLQRTGIELPNNISGAEVRIIYLDSDSVPGGVFIGHRSYQGVIIARATLADVAAASEITADAFPSEKDRIALVCETLDR